MPSRGSKLPRGRCSVCDCPCAIKKNGFPWFHCTPGTVATCPGIYKRLTPTLQRAYSATFNSLSELFFVSTALDFIIILVTGPGTDPTVQQMMKFSQKLAMMQHAFKHAAENLGDEDALYDIGIRLHKLYDAGRKAEVADGPP